MLNREQYQAKMSAIGFNILPLENYLHYLFYESAWLYYFQNIFLPNQNVDLNPYIRFIVMESCPGGGFPNPNYIFDNMNNNLTHPADKYLQQVYSAFFPLINWRETSKENALIQLSQQNVILLDIIPTHGFNLDENTRQRINGNLAECCCVDKFKSVVCNFPSIKIQWRTVFSMPPTHDTIRINNLIRIPNVPVYFGSMTAGSGFPSNSLLLDLINNGF